ncbi:hypothetical protein HanXRQr2_Chr10g0431801 [Helianthus annuus]|uniref:Uncharacterized protein n=1 Tax=Helianthus annuus TaxID=4232 RepID=A0A9K3N3T1_HELAN|nr:uncharacterized protein LOC110884935 [Helianthus annuus]KAF5785705.1 hypothetical protein HanXRQr2_Chr10g0431801 [Helianthus annuus]KAJ0521000.1 hypothetical protein HanIR_Chr10g0465781 [Helianthus annuus]
MVVAKHVEQEKVSPRAILQRPMAGSQVPYCPIEKKMSDFWSPLDPSTFKVCKLFWAAKLNQLFSIYPSSPATTERRENGGRSAANGCDSRRGCDAHNSGEFQKKKGEIRRSTG